MSVVFVSEATAFELLQAVYRNNDVPLTVRMRAASIALPFESPKLAVIANIEGDLGEALDRAIARSVARQNARVIEGPVDHLGRRLIQRKENGR